MMRLVIDNQEKKPLLFKKGVFGEMTTRHLSFGDYGIELDGKFAPIYFERKSLVDLFGTMGKGYERFRKEIKRSQEAKSTLILVIEGSMKDVFNGVEYSKIPGYRILKQLATLRVKYDLETHFFNSRREIARYIEDICLAVERSWK